MIAPTTAPLTVLTGGARLPAPSAEDVVREGLATHQESLRRAALRRTGDATDADDLVQETFVRALRFAGTFRPGTNLSAWLHTILRNTSINGLHAARLRPKTLDPEVSGGVFGAVPERGGDERPVTAGDFLRRRDEFDGRLHDAVAALPEVYRDVLLLSVVDGRPHRDIAEILGIPEGTVMSRLYRARNALRKTLEAPTATVASADRPAAA